MTSMSREAWECVKGFDPKDYPTDEERLDAIVHTLYHGDMTDQPKIHSPETCREWVEEKANNCYAPAAFIVWGKLHEPHELGPKCMDHLPDSLIRHLTWHKPSGYAAFDLRPYWTENS